MFSVDWQASVTQPVARVQASDADERAQLRYALSANDFFAINETSGVISVQRSLANSDDARVQAEVSVSDGEHTATAPIKVRNPALSAQKWHDRCRFSNSR